MRPAFNKRIAVENLFELRCRRRVQAEELDIVARIRFMDGDDIGGVIIEGGEPFFLLLRRPIGFHRRDVVIGFGCFFLEWAWGVHGSETGCSEELRRFGDNGANRGGQVDDFVIDDELPDHVHISGCVGNQGLLGGVIFLDGLEHLD